VSDLISLEMPQVLLIAVHQPKDRPLLKGKQDSVLPNALPDHGILVGRERHHSS
jgi:hypothetical protein